MMDKDAPLKKQAKILVNYINKTSKKDNCNSIIILGYSKSGVMSFEMLKSIDKTNYNKISLYNIATPYTGTKMASPKFLYNDANLLINKYIHQKKLEEKVYNFLVNVHNNISSNSHMDYDISLPNGIPDEYLDKYDETLLKNIFSNDNLITAKRIKRFKNFTTGIDENTLKRAILKTDVTGIGLCIINNLFMDKVSDGFVTTKSQEEISKHMDIKNIHIKSAHHDLFSDNKYSNKLLDIINDDLEEDKEKLLVKNKKIYL